MEKKEYGKPVVEHNCSRSQPLTLTRYAPPPATDHVLSVSPRGAISLAELILPSDQMPRPIQLQSDRVLEQAHCHCCWTSPEFDREGHISRLGLAGHCQPPNLSNPARRSRQHHLRRPPSKVLTPPTSRKRERRCSLCGATSESGHAGCLRSRHSQSPLI